MSAIEALVALGADRVEEHAALGSRTTYRVGGSVRLLVTLSSRDDLDELGPLMTETGLGILSIGNGSNLLVEDGEHDVLVVHLTGDFATLTWHDEANVVVVEAGAGLDMPIAARRLASDGVVGFEWAVGVPGTFGGGVAMNAGGHGADLAASLEEATIWTEGATRTWSNEQLRLGYRSSALRVGDVVIAAKLQLARGDATEADARVRDVVRWRHEHQPGGANGGSVFRNPPDDHAARLIESSGCKGLRFASARVSEKHANFIQADVPGRADDVFTLLCLVRDRVLEHTGVTLVSEHRFIGFGVTP
ncbi:MAG TPA: UDP-N-acetylmuramate dehydrogenase [Acidimicrobiales bacterium]|nr:UDP-N-acetylmuramate dehydrogenase [Acidimicrobiales bacterium]